MHLPFRTLIFFYPDCCDGVCALNIESSEQIETAFTSQSIPPPTAIVNRPGNGHSALSLYPGGLQGYKFPQKLLEAWLCNQLA